MAIPVDRPWCSDMLAPRATVRPQHPPCLVLVRVPNCRSPPTRPCTAHTPRASTRHPTGTRTRTLVWVVHFQQTPAYPHSSPHLCNWRAFDIPVAHTHRVDRLRRWAHARCIPNGHHALGASERRCCCAVAWRWPRVRNSMGTLDSILVRRHVHRCVCFCPRCMEFP